MSVAVGLMADSYNKPAAGGWTPASLSSLECWFDATVGSSFTYSTGNDPGDPGSTYVSQWRDLSGKANHANGSSNAGYHPKRNVTINGLTAVDCSTGYVAVLKSLGLTTYLCSESKPCSYFIVIRTAAALVGSTNIIGSGASGTTLRFSGTAGALELVMPAVGSIVVSIAGAVAAANIYVVGATYSATGQYIIRCNGVPISSGTLDRAVSTSTMMSLGGSSDTNLSSFGGYVGEAVICNTNISGTDLDSLESYLLTKWGLTITSPTDVSGLLAWYDASDNASFTYSSSTIVSQWNDKSGSGLHFTQGTVANQPNRNGSKNGKATLVFDGVDDSLTRASPISTLTDNFTMFAVYKRTGGDANGSTMFANGSTANGYAIACRAFGSTNVGWINGGINWYYGNPLPDTALHQVQCLRRASGTWSIHLNGVTPAAITGGPGAPSTPASQATICNATHKFAGEVAELLFYNVALSNIDRMKVESYLGKKWGL